MPRHGSRIRHSQRAPALEDGLRLEGWFHRDDSDRSANFHNVLAVAQNETAARRHETVGQHQRSTV